MNTHLDANLKQLRLPGIRENLAIRLQEAQAAQLGHEQFLELLIKDELALRTDRKTARALKTARFVNLKPLDHFDWQFNPNVDRGHGVRYISIFELVRELMDEEALACGRLLGKYLKLDLLIMRRYELRSTLMTSNRPIEDWEPRIGDVPAAGAILDRLLQSAEVIPFKRRSYRLRTHRGNEPGTPVNKQEEKGDL